MKRIGLLISVALLAGCGSALSQWARMPSPEIRVPLAPWALATDGEDIWVGTYRSTIYRSTDRGLSWAKSDSGISDIYWTMDLLVEGDTVFATGTTGVLRSTDRGVHWETKNNGFPSLANLNITAMVRSGDDHFVASVYGVFRSSNGGDDWVASTGVAAYWELSAIVLLDGLLFAGGDDGVHLSANGGSSWQPANAGLPGSPVYNLRVNRLLADSGVLYAGMNSAGIYRSSDHGASWHPDTAGLPGSGSGAFMPVYALARAGDYLYAGTQGDGVYRRAAAGGPWQRVSAGLPADAYVTSFSPVAGGLLAGVHDGGVFVSSLSDSITWTSLLADYPGIVETRSLGSSGDALFLFASSWSYNNEIMGLYRSTDPGSAWTFDSTLQRYDATKWMTSGDSVYALGSRLLFSADHGATWTATGPGGYDALVKSGDTLFGGWGVPRDVGEYGGVRYSADNGYTWTDVKNLVSTVYALAKTDGGLFAGGIFGVRRTTNLGGSWDTVNNGLPPGAYLSSLTALGRRIFASLGGRIYRTADDGEHWTTSTQGLPSDTSFTRFGLPLIVHDGLLIAGRDDGVFISADSGTTWSSAGSGLTGEAGRIRALTVVAGEIVAATYDGLWRVPIGGGSVVGEPPGRSPHGYALSQNYPNPFNPTTTISYFLPVQGPVKLTLFDATGREVAVLVDGDEPPGWRSLRFDGSGLASGAYFCRLAAGSHAVVKKLLLVR